MSSKKNINKRRRKTQKKRKGGAGILAWICSLLGWQHTTQVKAQLDKTKNFSSEKQKLSWFKFLRKKLFWSSAKAESGADDIVNKVQEEAKSAKSAKYDFNQYIENLEHYFKLLAQQNQQPELLL